MTGLVEAVRGKVDKACVENKGLKKKGCKISLQGAPRLRLVINFDKPGLTAGAEPATLRLSLRRGGSPQTRLDRAAGVEARR